MVEVVEEWNGESLGVKEQESGEQVRLAGNLPPQPPRKFPVILGEADSKSIIIITTRHTVLIYIYY